MLDQRRGALSASALCRAYQDALDGLSACGAPGWRVSDRASSLVTWRVFESTDTKLPRQGWKIHVSAAPVEAPSLCDAVVPLLIERRVSFKLPTSVEAIVALNSGEAGETQIGKVLTVYPRDDREAAELAESLDRLWPTSRGPAIPSDLALRGGSAVSFRYGAIRARSVVVDSKGEPHRALRQPDGSLFPDIRSRDGRQPVWAPTPPVECLAPSRFEPLKEIHVDGGTYVLIAPIHTSAASRVMLAVDFEGIRTVVVKVACRGVGSDMLGYDSRDRLANEYEVLEALADEQLLPRPLAFSKAEPAVLVMEDLRGTNLADLTRSEQIRSLPLLARAVARLHELGYVHCDLKLSNALLVGESIRLLDAGLTTPVGETRSLTGGTVGYVPPEGEDVPAAKSRDVYALGACIAHALLGPETGSLPGGRGRLLGLLHLHGANLCARLVKELLHPEPGLRPSAGETATLLERDHERLFALPQQLGPASPPADSTRPQASTDSIHLSQGPASSIPLRRQPLPRDKWILRAASESALATHHFVRDASDGHYWKNTHSMSEHPGEGLNLGAAGIILGLLTIAHALRRPELAADVEAAADWLAARPGESASAGLFTGNAGVALALSVVAEHSQRPDLVRHARTRLVIAAADSREIDLFNGAAGVVWAGCLMAEILDDDWPLEVVASRASTLVGEAEEAAGVVVWPRPATYLGAAHGSAGVALALGAWGRRTGHEEAMDLAAKTFRSLHQNGRTKDGLGLRMQPDTGRFQPARYWCHGVAGYLWCMLVAFGDESFLRDAIDWATLVFADDSVIGNPTYCHGLAGQLELWRMLAEIGRYQHLARAEASKTVAALRILRQRVGGRAVWSSDYPRVITPDLWIGFLAPATALALYAADRTDPLLSGSWLRDSCTGRKQALGHRTAKLV